MNTTEDNNKNIFSFRLLNYLFDNAPDYSSEENPDLNGVWKKLYRQIDKRKRQRLYLIRGAVAAAVVMFCIWGLSIFNYTEKEPAVLYISTTAKEVRHVTLPDGSQVFLNACSKLSYPKSFSDKREITLEGQAFFEVKKNPDLPFTVKTSSIDVEVLGTTFDMNCYPKDSIQETILVTGSVKVGFKKNGEQLLLSPNQKISYNKESGTFSVNMVKADELSGWKTGKLAFDSTPLSELIPSLEHWYNVKIVYNGDPATDERFSFILENDSLEYIFDFICASGKLDYKKEGDTIYLSRQTK